MNQIEVLATSLEYIENNLTRNIKTIDIANACYCSKSTLEKLFRCVNNISVHDYIIRRRMTIAAQIISERPEITLLEVALSLGYNSNESFTRAFEQIWQCKPSEYRKKIRYFELFPRLLCPLKNGDDYMETRKHVDISQLYDLFVERKNCYFICCDIQGLIPINEIARKAGDCAILETFRRMNEAAGEEDIAFRIGGDEYTLLTNSDSLSYAQEIADKIKQQNGQPFTYESQEIPLSLYVSITKLDHGTIKYSELFTKLHTSIKENKRN